MCDAATPAREPPDDWCDQLAARLAGHAGHPDLLSPRLGAQLLRLAKEVAHGSDAETALGEITREVAAMLRNDPAATP